MKTKLLKRLRAEGRSKITIYSITKTNEITTGMSIGMNSKDYKGLFNYGDTEEDVLKKAETIYLKLNWDSILSRYKKYSKVLKQQNK